MDTLQKQINTLDGKIDTLYHLVEQLTQNISQVVSEAKLPAEQSASYGSFPGGSARYYSNTRTVDPSMEHKDVLVDNHGSEASIQGGERPLSPEIQIQRLTAQLTAAYNRIAALEEQLLAQRIH